jgi:hypothetical protein
MLSPSLCIKGCSHHSIDHLMWESGGEDVPFPHGGSTLDHLYSSYESLAEDIPLERERWLCERS